MMKKRLLCLLAAVLLLQGCAFTDLSGYGRPKRYEETFLDLFDTVTTVKGYAASEEEFHRTAQAIHDELARYHRLYDIYHTYDGIANLKTVNDQAGIAPVAVDPEIIALLIFCREMCEATDGKVDVTFGAVLSLWHDAREYGISHPKEAYVPSEEALKNAAEHTGFGLLEIDEAAGTVYLTDADASLDVGAVAKGYAAAKCAENAPEGLLLSVGGNIVATGGKPDGTPWVVGIRDPEDGEQYVHTLNIGKLSVVSSGDYQRYYTVDGLRYHHIIDPDTLHPSTRWRAVTVLSEDSGLADILSTAIFILDRERGEALLETYHAEGMWISEDGARYYTGGFMQSVRE